MLKINQLTLALCASATLVACGGGGSSGDSTAAPVPAVLATAAYGGNWKDVCRVGDSSFMNSANVNMNGQYFVTITPLSDTTFSVVETVKHFAPSDMTCTGNSVAITQTKAPATFTVVGTTTIGGQVVDKITGPAESATVSLVSGAISITGSSLNATTVSLNGYSIAGITLAGDTAPTKGLLRATATSLYCGDSSTQTAATSFPTAMRATACYTKI